jgi:hypothetical protein
MIETKGPPIHGTLLSSIDFVCVGLRLLGGGLV